MSTLEFDMVRLTAGQKWHNPEEVPGGTPAYSRDEILSCAAEMPHLAWHCILAKYCGEELSIREVLRRAKMLSIQEWFTNAEHATKQIQAGQLNRVAELAVLVYLMPGLEHGRNYDTRAAYVGCGHEKFKYNFQSHYTWIISELGYNEHLGAEAYRRRKFGPKHGEPVHVTECSECGRKLPIA